MKRTRFFALLLSLCILLTACGSAAPTDDGIFNRAEADMNSAALDRIEMPFETSAAPEELKSESSIDAPVLSDRKLIKTVEIEAETEEYDALVAALEEKLAALGGYTESRQTGTFGKTRRWSNMTLRIPVENLPAFVAHVTEEANVLTTSEETQDVTLQYSDTEAKLAALKTEQARLMELLAAANNLSEILEIEARLSDVTYELERYESQKRGYDNRINYATVHLSLEEVAVLTPVEDPTVWTRICDGFTESLQGVGDGLVDLFVYLIAGSPYIAVTGAVLALVILLARKQSRKAQKEKQSAPSENP
ncbi:MAG: DUF4349 domain-containing protein [Oscillospiraceae bacterium]|nr:DUF4349 domain-containing protein [Oscillospiraceae bacterium]